MHGINLGHGRVASTGATATLRRREQFVETGDPQETGPPECRVTNRIGVGEPGLMSAIGPSKPASRGCGKLASK
jgi:hypothetical protein